MIWMLEYIRKNPPVSKCSSERGIHDDITKKINRRPDFIIYLRQKRQKIICVQKYLILSTKYCLRPMKRILSLEHDMDVEMQCPTE